MSGQDNYKTFTKILSDIPDFPHSQCPPHHYCEPEMKYFKYFELFY